MEKTPDPFFRFFFERSAGESDGFVNTVSAPLSSGPALATALRIRWNNAGELLIDATDATMSVSQALPIPAPAFDCMPGRSALLDGPERPTAPAAEPVDAQGTQNANGAPPAWPAASRWAAGPAMALTDAVFRSAFPSAAAAAAGALPRTGPQRQAEPIEFGGTIESRDQRWHHQFVQYRAELEDILKLPGGAEFDKQLAGALQKMAH